MKTKLRASVFRKAARLVAPSEELEGQQVYASEFSCICLARTSGGRSSPEVRFFERLFKCGGGHPSGDCTFNNLFRTLTIEKTYPLRLIALELAALLVEDGMTLEDLA